MPSLCIWPDYCRQHTPLGDDAAVDIGKVLGADNMVEMVARARKRAVGSMFPSAMSASGGSNRFPR